MKIDHLLPVCAVDLPRIAEPAYTVVNGDIYFTEDEHVAISILDSAPRNSEIMIVIDQGHQCVIYTNCFGTAIGTVGEVKCLIEDWIDATIPDQTKANETTGQSDQEG